jgi:hypothetical protein
MAPAVAVAIGGAAVSFIGGLFGMGAAKKRERAAEKRRQELQKKLIHLEETRQKVINPYDQVEDLSGMVKNPYDSLGVSTQAAEIQIEEADVSLANTLDALRTTGAGAGGATALAQAALQSKKGVSASIEQQEANNEKLRAQGKQQQQQQIMNEKKRMQQANVAGRTFEFQTIENRETAEMDRVAGQMDNASAQKMQAGADRTAAMTGMISGVGSAVTAGIAAHKA